MSLTPIFQRICDRRAELAQDKSYPKQLRAQFNNFRLGLLEQVAGARLLVNNNDLGEEVERILVQYLERRLGSCVRVLRGGHIYDYKGNRSDQVDIIVTPTDALGFCPAETGDGKFNVMIDQVIAVISVTSRLNAPELRKRWNELQKVPVFEEKQKSYPSLKGHTWPLCYIIGAESDDLESIEKEWDKITVSGEAQHNPQMVLLLDSGYMMARTACWPRSKFGRGPDSKLNMGTGIYAGLGLGWLEAQIAGRNCVLMHRSPDWVQRFSGQLSELELRQLPPWDPRYIRFGIASIPIHGIMKWGYEGLFPHNQLYLHTVIVGEQDIKIPLTDPTQPISKHWGWDWFKFEPRWFKYGVVTTKGRYLALEEWLNVKDREKHEQRIVVFDSTTGKEISDSRFERLISVSQLQDLDLSNLGG